MPSENTPSRDEIVLNPNAFTEFRLAGSPEVNFHANLSSLFLFLDFNFFVNPVLLMPCHQEIALDEASVKKAGSYLLDVIIPKFVKDLCNLEVSPMDGQTLSDALHAHGINIRYLGRVGIRKF